MIRLWVYTPFWNPSAPSRPTRTLPSGLQRQGFHGEVDANRALALEHDREAEDRIEARVAAAVGVEARDVPPRAPAKDANHPPTMILWSGCVTTASTGRL